MENSTLPALTGSPKQIEWATRIRAAALAEIDEFRRGMADWVADHPEVAAEEVANNRALDHVIATHPDCRWWIDVRDPAYAARLLRREAQAFLDQEK